MSRSEWEKATVLSLEKRIHGGGSDSSATAGPPLSPPPSQNGHLFSGLTASRTGSGPVSSAHERIIKLRRRLPTEDPTDADTPGSDAVYGQRTQHGGDSASASALPRNCTALPEELAAQPAQMAAQLPRNAKHFSVVLTAD
ncbi:hypothetical protein H4582DRAFT_2129163 [Lactarius indigo]|nr:hypothetical protein H4582DRAFT_2129163 [Lactarius indigo]